METTYASTARAHQMDRSRSISVENVEVRTSAWDATRSPTVAWNSIFVTSVGEMAQAARDAMVFPTPDWSWITVVCAEVTIAHAAVRKVSAADTENAIVPSRPAAATPVGQDPFATDARISAEGRTATAGEIARPTLESANARKPGPGPPASTRPADPEMGSTTPHEKSVSAARATGAKTAPGVPRRQAITSTSACKRTIPAKPTTWNSCSTRSTSGSSGGTWKETRP